MPQLSTEKSWMPLAEAWRALIHILAEESGYNVAHRVAKETLDGLLLEGRIEAIAEKLEWSITRECGAVEILGEGRAVPIPRDFWLHYFDAQARQPDLLLVTIPPPDGPRASRQGNDFSFYDDRGFREGIVSMAGRAEGVVVRRDQVPRLPRQKGRRPGSSRLISADASVVENANRALVSGRKRADVVAEFAPLLEGPSSLDSKKRRLRMRLGALGSDGN